MNYIKNWEDVVSHILSCYPNEGGGVILKDNTFVPLTNRSDTPRFAYDISTSDWAEYADDIKAVLHSHATDPTERLVDDPRIPSKADMQGQLDTDVEWAIVVTEGENVTEPVWFGNPEHRPDLMDREFIHSIQDCLEFMRDWQFKEYGLVLPSFPRNYDWFEKGENHFEDQYEAWGFYDATNELEARGDVLFYSFDSDVVNHIGVVPEPGLVVHHPFNKKPVVEPQRKYRTRFRRRIRHKTSVHSSKNE